MTSTLPNAPARPNTQQMVTIHKVFRAIFAALPGLVRDVRPGDTARAEIVGRHWLEVSTGLHHHHTLEDEMLWPKLLDRVDLDRNLVVRAEEQHERVAELIRLAARQMAAFVATASAADAAEAAKTMTELNRAVVAHMDDEEADVLPLVERFITVEEWNALTEAGHASMPGDRLLIQVGFILDACTPQERVQVLAELPFVARAVWYLVGRRAYRQERRVIYGR